MISSETLRGCRPFSGTPFVAQLWTQSVLHVMPSATLIIQVCKSTASPTLFLRLSILFVDLLHIQLARVW